MARLCPFCSYSQSAVQQRALAKEWDDQGLKCLGTPHLHIALQLEAQACSEKRCKCDQPNQGWKLWEGLARYK